MCSGRITSAGTWRTRGLSISFYKMVEEQATDPKPSPSLLCQSALRLVLDESIENLGKLYSEAKWVDPRNSPYYIYVMFILFICLYLY